MRVSNRPWRVGRKLGRTLYEMRDDDTDLFLGMMETRELAEYVVEIVNKALTERADDDA